MSANSVHPSSHRLAARILLLSLGLLFALLLVEIVLRVITPAPVKTIRKIDDPILIYAHIPSFSLERPGWNVHYNSLGFRGPEIGPKRPGRPRVLFIGDSITDGARDDDIVYPALVERLRARTKKPIEAINGGVTGYNVEQVFRSLQLDSPLVEPDSVVYGFCLNDILPPGAVDEGGALKPARFSLGVFLRRSRLVVRTGRFLQSLFIRRNRKPPIGDYAPYCRRVLDMYRPEEPRYHAVLDTLDRMAAYCGTNDLDLTVVFFPLATQFMGDDTGAQRTLTRFLERRRVRVIDLWKPFQENGGAALFVMNDPVHPTEEGHRLTARIIAEKI
ncbi:MAG: SGNH/GDSL hydrolase family protein [Candidatus Hydrogenedentota bacterium]|nr:MAG: SGNH/GDSL hydrolase family protein [Candidatus Hydrogenedentota bacterium]